MTKIQVIGLTITDIALDNGKGKQYTLLTQSRGVYQEYTFTQNERGLYEMRINPAAYNDAKMLCATPTELIWHKGTLTLVSPQGNLEFFSLSTNIFTPPIEFFIQESTSPMKRSVLIINGNADEILPFISSGNVIAYADEWDSLPSALPEDVIVLNEKEYPIQDILLRLPINTNAIVLNSTIYGAKKQGASHDAR